MIDHSRGAGIIKVSKVHSRCLARRITEILPSNSWAGETCFIIGGGPSLTDFDWSQLKGFKVIGINKAFQHYDSDVNYSMDYNFFDKVHYHGVNPGQSHHKLHQDWLAYRGIKLFVRHNDAHYFAEGIFYVSELLQKVISFDLNKGIYAGNNSGMGALMLAIALGCKKIGLLGYDFQIAGDKTHFHEGYGFVSKSYAANLESFRLNIDELAPAMLQLGIDIVNLSPASALRNFPKATIESFINQKSSV
jgi:hypothetical protein